MAQVSDAKARTRKAIREAVRNISPEERERFAGTVSAAGGRLFGVLKALRGECPECGTGKLGPVQADARKCQACGHVVSMLV